MSARIREVRLGAFDLVLERRPDGTIRARSPHPLGAYPSRLTERLEHWAEHAPERPSWPSATLKAAGDA